MDLVSLATTPFLLAARAAVLATLVWLQLLRVPFDLACNAAAATFALLSLPARILTALHRERTLEMTLNELQIQLECLALETKELEGQLRTAVRERNGIETMFEEVEDEHAKALSRIDQLENQLQDLKQENTRLYEIRGKAQLDYEAHDGRGGGYVHEGIPLTAANYVIPSWGTGHKKTSEVMLEDVLKKGDPWRKVKKAKKIQEQSLQKLGAGSCPIPSQHGVRDVLVVDEVLERRRSVALGQTLFSAVLSLLVGIIMWKAEDPCMPLVAALFIVVGMSLSSVVQFFATIKNKPASDAVALLSFNWFILGTLTSPSLPSITHVLAPRAIKIVGRVATWFGLSTYLC